MKIDYSSQGVDPANPEPVYRVMRDPWAHGVTRCIMCGRRELAVSGFVGLDRHLLVYILCERCADTPEERIRARARCQGGGLQ